MPTECEVCKEMYEKADDEPTDICPTCWEVQASYYTGAVSAPTAEEQAQEAAYYASLECADLLAKQAQEEHLDDDDDRGYCGPTCGRFGDW